MIKIFKKRKRSKDLTTHEVFDIHAFFEADGLPSEFTKAEIHEMFMDNALNLKLDYFTKSDLKKIEKK